MLLQVNGIGKQKIKYKDHDTLQFDSLDSYLLLAKKAISKFANSMYSGLASKMLKDEDAICAVANAIMMADWRWDDNYKSPNGTKKTKYSYRNQCALWAIQTYATKNKKRSKHIKNMYSLDYKSTNTEQEMSIHECIQDDSSYSPETLAIMNENKNDTKALIDSIFNLNCLSDRQKDYIRLYYLEGYTFDKIGKKYGITREAVRQGLNKGIESIKNLIGNN